MKSNRLKKWWVALAAAISAVAVALVVHAHHVETRDYVLVDRTSQDRSNRFCQEINAIVVAKCSSHSDWTTVETGLGTTFTCPKADDVKYRNGDEIESETFIYTWSQKCPAFVQDPQWPNAHVDNMSMRVHISGTWDCQMAHVQLTAAQSGGSCIYSLSYPDD